MAAHWEIAANSAYDMFSKYKYLIVNLVFPISVLWSGNIFLIVPFPDHCLFVHFHIKFGFVWPRCFREEDSLMFIQF